MYSKLIPILPVSNVLTERAFYEALGFRPHVDPDETYPENEFAALASGEHILFGLAYLDSSEALTEHGLYWQIETTDIDAVHALALAGSLTVIEAPTLQQWGRKTMMLESPNGYRVGFEEATS